MHFVVSLGIALVIWVGSYLIVHHQITAGNFVSFVAALILLYNPIKGIGNNFNNVQIALMAMERVFELLQQAPKIVETGTHKELIAKPDSIYASLYQAQLSWYIKDIDFFMPWDILAA